MGEGDFIALMRLLATHPAARGLADDAAVLDVEAGQIVLTHDMLVEGVHYLADDPAADVAWKLVAVNMSDLAAKGAKPLGILLAATLPGDEAWGRDFASGLQNALVHFGVPLLGGDTVSGPSGGPLSFGLTAIGRAPACGAPSRSGAKAGDLLFVSGSLGDAGVGLALLKGEIDAPEALRPALVTAYRRPAPSLAIGESLASLVTAMADISDGLLIDAQRIGHASGCGIRIDLDAVPLSAAFAALYNGGLDARLAAVTSGDDYRLLFTVPSDRKGELDMLAKNIGISLYQIGRCIDGSGLDVFNDAAPVTLPERLGYEHGQV